MRALGVYLLIVFLGAGLLAPWVYWLVQYLAEAFPGLRGLAGAPFHRYVNRCLLALALIGLWPWMRAMGVRGLSSVGLGSVRGQWSGIRFALLLSLMSLALVAAGGVVAGSRELPPSLSVSRAISLAGSALASALAVGLLEELLFRGVLYGRMRPAIGELPAVILSSGIYSITHFFQRPPPPELLNWTTGFTTLGTMFRGFAEFESLVPGFLTLALAGVILARLCRTTGAIYAPMALHSGWIFWMKLHGGLTVEKAGGAVRIWGSSKLIDGWAALVVMILCAILVFRRKSRA